MRKILSTALLGFSFILVGCATESARIIESDQVKATQSAYHGVKAAVAVGQFANRSTYQNGIFSDGVDRLGSQSQTILVTHLQQSGRFSVLDRANIEALSSEAQYRKKAQSIQGARYIITGDVVEFGRKNVGDHQLFGILGRGKSQVAYAKVNLNVVDVITSEVIYSSQGAGEYSLSTREVVGFGSTASYDATLNGKVLGLAIREAVDNLVIGIDNGTWSVQK